ncbi:MAG: hypothetical protein HY961_19945 [Ignavibacteriae bacterium]|nr:hypothetical protein [Ignavibacteriota bacterium]
MKRLGYILVTVIGIQLGCDDNPANNGKSQNHNPVITSVVMFPEVVGPSDSLIVVCDATDPDGDSLVYDWYSLSGSIVKIKGAHGHLALYNTPENSRIFYAPDSQYVAAPQDTFGLECAVRDLRGGMGVSGLRRFIVTRAF